MVIGLGLFAGAGASGLRHAQPAGVNGTWPCHGRPAKVRFSFETSAAEGGSEPLSVAFAGSSLLINYYFGVMSMLQTLGIVDPNVTRFGGISGGAITSMLTCAGQTPHQIKDAFAGVMDKCREDPMGNCFQKLNTMAKSEIYDPVMTEPAHAKCGKGRVRVGITALNEALDSFDGKRAIAVDTFSGPGDMEEALLASSYLSCFSGPWTYVTFRGRPVIDGGYAADFSDICPEGSRCIKVSVWIVGENVTTNGVQSEMRCLGSPAEETYNPLPAWPNFQDPSWRLNTSCKYDYNKFHSPTNPDIFPAHFNRIKWSKPQWQNLSACISSKEDVEYVFEMGLADAKSWYDREYPLTDLREVIRSHFGAGAVGEKSEEQWTSRRLPDGSFAGEFTASFRDEEATLAFATSLRKESSVESLKLVGIDCVPPAN